MSCSTTSSSALRRFLRLPHRFPLPSARQSQLMLLILLSIISLLLFFFLPQTSVAVFRLSTNGPTFEQAATTVLRNHSFLLTTVEQHGLLVAPVLLLPLVAPSLSAAANLRCHLARVLPRLQPVVVAYDAETAAWAQRHGHAVVPPPQPLLRAVSGKKAETPASVEVYTASLLMATFRAGLDALVLDAAALPCTDFTFRLRQELLLNRASTALLTSSSTIASDSYERAEEEGGNTEKRGRRPSCGLYDRAFILARRDTRLRAALRKVLHRETYPSRNCFCAFQACSLRNIAADMDTTQRVDCVVRGVRMAILSHPFFPPLEPLAWRRTDTDNLRKACISGHFALWRAPGGHEFVRDTYESGGVWLARNVSTKCVRMVGPPCKFCGYEQR